MHELDCSVAGSWLSESPSGKKGSPCGYSLLGLQAPYIALAVSPSHRPRLARMSRIHLPVARSLVKLSSRAVLASDASGKFWLLT